MSFPTFKIPIENADIEIINNLETLGIEYFCNIYNDFKSKDSKEFELFK
jgi:hypothetical protein